MINQANIMTKLLVATLIGALMSTTAAAQAQTDFSESQDQWQFAGAIYLWGADIGGKTIGGAEIEVGFSDLLDNLEMAFMGAFAARKNNWSFLTDVVYLDLGVNSTADFGHRVPGWQDVGSGTRVPAP